MAWGLGGREAATWPRLDAQLTPCTAGVWYPDDGDAGAQVVPKARHLPGTAPPHAMARDHAPTRHHLARMTRRTTVVAHSRDRRHASVQRWCALHVQAIFEAHQATFRSIFN